MCLQVCLSCVCAVHAFIPVLSRLLLGGYQVDVRVLNSAHWGVPQARQASKGVLLGSGD